MIRAALLLLAACGAAAAPPSPVHATAPPALLAEGDHAVDVGGVTLVYHVHGHGPVCIVHSGGPGLQWSYLRMPAVEADLTLVYLEPAGTGGSSALPAYSLARYAELLDGFRAQLGLSRACVLGHSYGGFIAEHWAIAHPDHVGALILYDTSARRGPDVPPAAELAGAMHEPWFPAAMAAAARESTLASDADADALLAAEWPLLFGDWTHRRADYTPALAGVHAYFAPLRASELTPETWDVRPALAQLHVPALVIVGVKDWITPRARAEEIAQALPGATLVVLPTSGHMGHIEDPAGFAAAIHAFVPAIHAALDSAASPLAEGDHVATVGGVHLAYHVHGRGPVCIVHPQAGVDWLYLRMPAVEADLKLVYLEAAGTGASDPLPAYSLGRYAELLDQFRAVIGVRRACVLGQAWGGFVALEWAALHPDHVGALILYSTSAWAGPENDVAKAQVYKDEPWFAAAMAAIDRQATIRSDADADALMAAEWPLQFADFTHHEAAYRAALASTHVHVTPARAMLGTSPFDLRPALAAVHAPTLVITGGKDVFIPPKRAADIVDAIAGATMVVLPNSGSLAHLEEPEAFAAATRAFAAQLPRY